MALLATALRAVLPFVGEEKVDGAVIDNAERILAAYDKAVPAAVQSGHATDVCVCGRERRRHQAPCPCSEFIECEGAGVVSDYEQRVIKAEQDAEDEKRIRWAQEEVDNLRNTGAPQDTIVTTLFVIADGFEAALRRSEPQKGSVAEAAEEAREVVEAMQKGIRERGFLGAPSATEKAAERADYEITYDSDWKQIIEEGGVFNVDQIKRELHDFSFLMEQASKVYDHVTGGKLSKTTYTAQTVTTEADDYLNTLCDEAVKDALLTTISIYDDRFPRQGCDRTGDHDDHLWWFNGTTLLCAGPGASSPEKADDYADNHITNDPTQAPAAGWAPGQWMGADDPEPSEPEAPAAPTIHKTWFCKVGEVHPSLLPQGADWGMRQAVQDAYKALTGEEPVFIFSGWAAKLTESERAVVEDRLPIDSPCPRCGKPGQPGEGVWVHHYTADAEACSAPGPAVPDNGVYQIEKLGGAYRNIEDAQKVLDAWHSDPKRERLRILHANWVEDTVGVDEFAAAFRPGTDDAADESLAFGDAGS